MKIIKMITIYNKHAKEIKSITSKEEVIQNKEENNTT